MLISLFFLLLDMPLISFAPLSNSRNEHRPHDISWLITDAYGQTLNSTFNRTIVDSWFPDLYFDYGQMLLGVTAYNHSSDAPSPSPGFVHKYHFYVCPGHMTNADYRYRCGGVSDYFCKHWDCVSSGNIWWDPPMKGDYIRLQKGSEYVPCPGYGRGTWEEDDDSKGRDDWPLCNPVKLSFTSEGRKYEGWERGVTWGGRIYAAGYDYGNIFTITRRVALPPSPPLGPNSKVVQYSFLQPRASTPHPLLSLLNSTFSFLNASQPNWTTSCWVCASAVPPFYEAVGSIENPSMNKSDSNCRWRNGTQSLHSLTGTGRCLGNVPHNYSSYCDNTTKLYNGTHYVPVWQPYNNSDKHRANFTASFKDFFFLPGPVSWWACSTGLTACVHGPTLASQQGFCIQVQILPKILYYPPDQMLQQYSSPPRLQKREVVTVLTLSVLLGLGVAGASTGVTALVAGRQQYYSLRLDIDTDLERIETSITHLQESLTSLSEVVLQNRRGLDLLFLQEGGLCVALREECCFYADHSGIVGDSMEKLREGLACRRRERAEQQFWYQNMFNLSPWLTTLLSAIAGPLILLLLVCAVAPCVLNRALWFIKTRLATVEAMVLAAPETVVLLKAPYQHSSDEEAAL